MSIELDVETMKSLDKEEFEAKDKAFYSAMVGAWLNTKLERDKQLLGLSVTAIGLLVTLLRTVGVSSFSQTILFGFALFSFLITVISAIYILDKNATHIEEMLRESEEESIALMILDKVVGISFVIGMVLIVMIGIHSALINLDEKGVNMSQEKSSNINNQSVTNNDSWNGVARLRPQPPSSPQTSSSASSVSSSSSSSDGNGSSNTDKSGSGS